MILSLTATLLVAWHVLLATPLPVRQTTVRQTSVCRSSGTGFHQAIKKLKFVGQQAKIETKFDSAKNLTTVQLMPVQISGPKDKYHSLHFAASFTYPGQTPSPPSVIDFELRSVVKTRKLKIDLYVLFVVDGETIFLSSNRSAIKNPVPGKQWKGERLVFRMPYEVLLRITTAKQVEIKMDAVRFDVAERQLEALRDFVRKIPTDPGS